MEPMCITGYKSYRLQISNQRKEIIKMDQEICINFVMEVI
jgi:hypothetical protein